MKSAFELLKIEVKLLLREKSFYIWTIILPLVFTLFFSGFIKRGSKDIPDLYILKKGNYKELISIFEKEDIKCKSTLKNGKHPLIVPNNNFKFSIIFDERTSGKRFFIELMIYKAIIKHVLKEKLFKGKFREILKLNEKKLPSQKSFPSGIEHTLFSVVGVFLLFNVMIFGFSTFSRFRERGIIKRFITTPSGNKGIKLSFFIIFSGFGIVFSFVMVIVLSLFFKPNFELKSIILFSTVLIVYVLFVSSASLLISILSTKKEKTMGLIILTANLLSALGGLWWPIEIVSKPLKKIAMFIPTRWFISAIDKIFFYKKAFVFIGLDLMFLLFASTILIVISYRLRIR